MRRKRDRHGISPHRVIVIMTILAIGCPLATGDVLHIYPGDSFEEAVENLNPGDTLNVHAGTYIERGRISIGAIGTETAPIVIRAADAKERPLIARPENATAQNTINIEGAEYLTISGLEISSNGGDGVRLTDEPAHITLDNLIIHDISVGINFRSNMHDIVVRRSQIYGTNNTGEGIYVGCDHGKCTVRNSLIENNWIYDTLAATQGDGIEIKPGSHSNIIRNNVIHDTHWPCILLYGTQGQARNIVEGNIMWNCGDSGIQAAADAVIRNNIILDSPGIAFNSRPHQGIAPKNLEFIHNTVIGGNTCLYLRDWDKKTGLVFANNAVYCPEARSVVGKLGGVASSGNVFLPPIGGFPADTNSVGISLGADFSDPINHDVYPRPDSALLNAGDQAHVVEADFNGTQRRNRADAGAFSWSGERNPGPVSNSGFKDADRRAATAGINRVKRNTASDNGSAIHPIWVLLIFMMKTRRTG